MTTPPRTLWIVALLLSTASTARAQLPLHRLQSVFPSGGRAGETVEVQITGADLEGVDGLWFDHPGLRAFQRKGPTFVVAIAPGTPSGYHDVRLVGPLGVSNPRAFVVGERPESREVEPNNTVEQANAIVNNSTANGRADAQPDVDHFAFEGKAGRRVVLDLAAERVDSRFDGVLTLFGPDGRELAASHDYFGPDPLLDVTLPADGRYVARVHDVVFNGSPDHGYRLTVHDGPQQGASLALLGSTAVRPPDPTDPIALEVEPNDLAHPQTIAPPCDVSGRFGEVGDVDVYRFAAKKGDVWWIEAMAERLGSPADPSFVVQRIMPQGPPQDSAFGDDLTDPTSAGNPRFPTASVDASVRWIVPEDGTYQVVLSDLYQSQRGGPRFSYRLNVRPERPDFRLFVVPDDAAQPGAIVVRAGGRTTATLVVNRIDGFNGPIRVEASELPGGLSVDPVVIGPGQFTAPLVVTAATDCKSINAPIRLTGRALSGDRKEVLDFTPGASKVRAEATHEALPGSLVWPPMGGQGPVAAPARLTHGLVVAVRETAPLRLTATPSEIVVPPNTTANVQVEATRHPTVTEAIQVTATDLPPNMGAASVSIAKGANAATLALTVPANVPPGRYTILLRGTAPFPFSKDPNANPKPNVNATEPSNPITLTILR